MKLYICLLFLLTLILINGCSLEIQKICFEENCFDVEVADSESERAKGLMNRTNLLEYKGMLFVFDFEGIYGVWMKDTLIPLDIIWINSNKEVVFIQENAQPCKEKCEIYKNNQKALYVLEMNAGKAKELDIKIEDTAKF